MAIVFDMKQVKEDLKATLEGWGMDAVERMSSSVAVASGHLKDNMDWKVTTEGDNVICTISMPKYAEYVEYGRPPGKMPPLSAIKDWLQIKGMADELAYPIAKKIADQGTRPQPFIRPYWNQHLVKDLHKNLIQSFK